MYIADNTLPIVLPAMVKGFVNMVLAYAESLLQIVGIHVQQAMHASVSHIVMTLT